MLSSSEICPDGEEYNSATDSCDRCPIGYYKKNDVDGDFSPCVLCPTEFITAMNGTKLMSDCNIGTQRTVNLQTVTANIHKTF